MKKPTRKTMKKASAKARPKASAKKTTAKTPKGKSAAPKTKASGKRATARLSQKSPAKAAKKSLARTQAQKAPKSYSVVPEQPETPVAASEFIHPNQDPAHQPGHRRLNLKRTSVVPPVAQNTSPEVHNQPATPMNRGK